MRHPIFPALASGRRWRYHSVHNARTSAIKHFFYPTNNQVLKNQSPGASFPHPALPGCPRMCNTSLAGGMSGEWAMSGGE